MNNLSIEIREVTDRKMLKTFIYLPSLLYKDFSNWVPPMYIDEWKFHNPKENTSLQYADVCRWIAYRNKKTVGRIMGIIHHKYNTVHHEKTARFFQLDCINDASVAEALIDKVENWALKNGMNFIIGPYGFSDKDPQGLQIEGFEHLPVIATPANPSYLPRLVVQHGYRKYIDCVSYKITVPDKLLPLYEKIHERISRNQKIHLVEFRSKRQMKPFVVPIFRLVNETFTRIFGFVPMDENEMKKMAAQYMPVLDPAFVKVVIDDKKEVIAFIVAMPGISKGIQKAKGKVFPFGFIHILKSARQTNQLNLMLGAVKQNHRGRGLNVLMGAAIINSAIKRGFKIMDSHLVLEENALMCAEYEKLGGEIYKRYRVFGKKLT